MTFSGFVLPMASFHKDPKSRSPYWYVAFKDANGNAKFRSTKQVQLSQAQEVGLKWERMANDLRKATQAQSPSAIPLKNSNGVLERFIEVTQVASRGELTEAVARKFLDELLKGTGLNTLSGGSVREFLDGWVERKKTSRADGTYLRYRRTIDDFIEFLGPRADRALAAITIQDIEKFRDRELSSNKRPATVKTALAALGAAFNRARRLGIILTNPIEGIESVPRNSAERRPFTLDEIRRLLLVCNTNWKGMVLVGYHLGLRIQDCASLKWQDVDFDRKVLTHRPQKERRDRAAKKIETYMPEELRAFLREIKPHKLNPDRALFPALHEMKSGGDHGLSLTFRRLLDLAKIEYKDVSNGKGRKFYDLGFHSLRHTCVSVMANIGVSEELRKEHVGHDSEVHKRYTHLDIQTFENALAAMPRLLSPVSV